MNSINMQKFHSKLVDLDENEKIICEIRKHPIGYIGIHVIGVLVAICGIAFSIFIAASVDSALSESFSSGLDASFLIIAIGSLLSLFLLGISFISAHLYRQDVLLVTTDKIVQVLNLSLFNRKVSQLKISDAQDVTVVQAGIIAKAFNFGTITVETAGEQTNYTFTYAPNPYERAKEIMTIQESIKTKIN